MSLERALQFFNKLNEHEKVASEVLGGYSFVIEVHPEVWKFLKEWLFYPCFAIEGGVTLFESWTGDWLDLRCYGVYEKSERRVVLLLGLKVAYNHPDAISTETTRKACERFVKVIRRLNIRFEPATENNRKPILSEADLERQRKMLDEFLDEIVVRIKAWLDINVDEKVRELLSSYIDLIRKYGGKKLRERELSLYDVLDTLERITSLVKKLDNEDDPINKIVLRIASRDGITKTLLRKAKPKVEEIRRVIDEARRIIRMRKVAEEAKKRLEWPYGWLAYWLEELGLI